MKKVMRKGYWLGTVDSYLNRDSADSKRIAPTSLKDLKELSGKGHGRVTTAGLFSGDDSSSDNEEVMDVGYMTEVSAGIGIIRIVGTLVNEYSPGNRWWGDVSYEEVAAAAEVMQRDSEVKAVILYMDTPGGDANGIEHGSSALSRLAAEKPVYAFTASQMCSAGYWLGCTAKQIWASTLAIVGSIGVVAIHVSYEKMYEKAGVTPTVFRQGQYKMLLNQYEDLTQEAKDMMESQMSIIYSMFIGHVADRRNIAPATLMAGPGQGQTFLGVQAVKEGLVDQIGDFAKLVNQLRSKYASQVAGIPGAFTSCDRGLLSMKTFNRGGKLYALNARGQAAVSAGLSEDDAGKNDEFLVLVTEQGQVADEKTAEEIAAEEAAAKTKAEEEAAATAAAEVEANGKQTPVSAASVDLVMQLTEKLTVNAGAMANMTAQLASLQAQIELKDASLSGLRKVAIEAINNKEVAMNMAISKAEDFDNDGTILTKYNRLISDFNGRYKPGQKAEHSSTTTKASGTADNSGNVPHSESAQNLTTFGSKGR